MGNSLSSINFDNLQNRCFLDCNSFGGSDLLNNSVQLDKKLDLCTAYPNGYTNAINEIQKILRHALNKRRMIHEKIEHPQFYNHTRKNSGNSSHIL